MFHRRSQKIFKWRCSHLSEKYQVSWHMQLCWAIVAILRKLNNFSECFPKKLGSTKSSNGNDWKDSLFHTSKIIPKFKWKSAATFQKITKFFGTCSCAELLWLFLESETISESAFQKSREVSSIIMGTIERVPYSLQVRYILKSSSYITFHCE